MLPRVLAEELLIRQSPIRLRLLTKSTVSRLNSGEKVMSFEDNGDPVTAVTDKGLLHCRLYLYVASACTDLLFDGRQAHEKPNKTC